MYLMLANVLVKEINPVNYYLYRLFLMVFILLIKCRMLLL